MGAVKRMVGVAAGGMILVVGLVFAVAAGYDELWLHYGPVIAKLIMAAIFIVLGGIVIVIVNIQAERRRREAARSNTSAIGTAFALGLMGGLGRRKKT